MKKRLILSIFILTLQFILLQNSSECIATNECFKDSIRYKIIMPEWFYDFTDLKIVQDSVLLSGYLVFEFDIEQNNSDTANDKGYFHSSIYVVRDLLYINNLYKRFYFSFAMGLLYNYFSILAEGFNREYSHIINNQNYRRERKNCPDSYYKSNFDKINILINENYWVNPDDENTGYFIFYTEFETLILENDLYYKNTENNLTTITGAKVIVPFDNCIEIISIGDKVLYETNLKEGIEEINLTY